MLKLEAWNIISLLLMEVAVFFTSQSNNKTSDTSNILYLTVLDLVLLSLESD